MKKPDYEAKVRWKGGDQIAYKIAYENDTVYIEQPSIDISRHEFLTIPKEYLRDIVKHLQNILEGVKI